MEIKETKRVLVTPVDRFAEALEAGAEPSKQVRLPVFAAEVLGDEGYGDGDCDKSFHIALKDLNGARYNLTRTPNGTWSESGRADDRHVYVILDVV